MTRPLSGEQVALLAGISPYRREALEFEAEIRKGRYIEAEYSFAASERAGMTTRDAMLAVPARVASQLVGLDDEREIVRLLTAELRAELTRLAMPARERLVAGAIGRAKQFVRAGCASAWPDPEGQRRGMTARLPFRAPADPCELEADPRLDELLRAVEALCSTVTAGTTYCLVGFSMPATPSVGRAFGPRRN